MSKILKRTAALKVEVIAINTRLIEVSATLEAVKKTAKERLMAVLVMRTLFDTHEAMIRDQQLVLDMICTKVVAVDNVVANTGTTGTINTDRYARIYVYIEIWLE